MKNMKTVSRQATSIYKLLNNGRVLTAQEIADELNVLPNAIYRAAKKLVDLGIVEQVETYPTRFKAIPGQTALNLYTMGAIQDFRREFGLVAQAAQTDGVPSISLLKDRKSMLRQDSRDARAAKYSIDFIVSGHEVPDETILAFRKAITVGVTVRMIVHQKEQAYSRQTKEWQKIGVDVRFLPGLDMRLFIYDKRIVYLTSYDPKNPGSAFGVRFNYPPLALQMSQLFEQNWERAKTIQ
jgi:sugar-specific transcriptional regulator TrmB